MKRRMLSVALAVLIVISGFVVILPFSASANSTNLITNGNFETGDVSGWEVYNNSGNSTAAFTVTGDTTNKYANGVAGLSLFKQVSLEAGVEYTMSFDFKFDDGTVPLTNPTTGAPTYYDSFYRAGFVTTLGALGGANFVGPNTTGNKYYQTYTGQGAEKTAWKNHTFKFTPATAMTVYAVIGSYSNACVVGINIDNVILCKTSDLVTINTAAESGGTAIGTKTTCKGDSVTVAATPNTGYHFDGWYNGASLISAEQNYTFTADSSMTLTARFSTGVATANMLKNGDFNNGSITGFEVFNNSGNSAATFAFEGDANKVLTGVAGLSLYKQVSLEAGVEYTMSFDFKFTDSTVPTNYDSFYRAGFVTSLGALSGGNFVGPYPTASNKYYNIYSVQKSNPTAWMTHTFKFTPATAMTVYAVVGSYNNQGVSSFSMDNLSLCKTSDLVTIGVTAETGGTVTGAKSVCKGETVSVTATPNNNYSFDGWYLNNAPVSTDLTYTFNADSNVNLVAKFKDNTVITKTNLVKNGDFEEGSWTTGWTKIGSSLSYIWDVNAANFVAGDTAALNGARYVKSGASETAGFTDQSRSFGQKDIALQKNTDYVLAFWAKSDLLTFRAGVIRNDQVHPASTYELVAGSTIALDKGSSWAFYKISFNSGSNTVAAISFGNQLGGIEGKYYYLDNVVLSKASDYITVSATATKGGTVDAPSGVVSVGTAVTVKAFPDEGYKFDGWYSGNTLVSADKEYTFTVAESVDLTAKFSSTVPKINLIENGTFEDGTTNGWTVYKTGGTSNNYLIANDNGSKVAYADTVGLAMFQQVQLQAGVEYVVSFDFKFGSNATVPDTYNTFYRSGFMSSVNSLSNANFTGPNSQYIGSAGGEAIYYSIYGKQTDKTKWQNHTYSFTPATNMTTYFVIGAVNQQCLASYSVDNVTLAKKSDVSTLSVTAIGPGTASSSASGILMPGSKVNLTATPLPGAAFRGWYENSVLISTSATYQYTVTGNAALVAQFGDSNDSSNQKLYNSHFEKGNLSGWSLGTVGSAIDTKLVTELGETFVRIPRDNQLYQPVALKPHGVYVLTVKARTPGISEAESNDWYRAGVFGINTPNALMGSSIIPNEKTWVDLYTIGKNGKEDTGWNTYNYYFTNSTANTVMANVVIGDVYNTPAFEVEYATFYEVVSGVMDINTSKIYGEEFFNNIPNATFEQALANDNWGTTLPSGWSVYSGHKETGNKFLKISGSEKTYAVKVDPSAVYYFGVSLKAEKAGNSTFSLVDSNGVTLGDSYGKVTTKASYKPSANGKWQRFGAQIFSGSDGYVYIKLSGKNNTLSIDDITFVKERYGKSTDPNYYGPDGTFNYNNPVYYSPMHFYSVDTGTDNGGTNNDETPNANTGDHSNLVFFICLSSVLGCGYLLLKTAKSTRSKGEVVCK